MPCVVTHDQNIFTALRGEGAQATQWPTSFEAVSLAPRSMFLQRGRQVMPAVVVPPGLTQDDTTEISYAPVAASE